MLPDCQQLLLHLVKADFLNLMPFIYVDFRLLEFSAWVNSGNWSPLIWQACSLEITGGKGVYMCISCILIIITGNSSLLKLGAFCMHLFWDHNSLNSQHICRALGWGRASLWGCMCDNDLRLQLYLMLCLLIRKSCIIILLRSVGL